MSDFRNQNPNELYDFLIKKTDHELSNLYAKKRELNNESIQILNSILKNRGIDLEEIKPVASNGELGLERVKTDEKSEWVWNLGIFLLSVFIAIILYNAFPDQGAGNIEVAGLIIPLINGLYWVPKVFKTNRLRKYRDETIDLAIDEEQLSEALLLNRIIVEYHSHKNPQLVAEHLNSIVDETSFQNLDDHYKKEFYSSFIEDICELSSRYDILKDILDPLIKKGIIEPNYPHKVILK